MDLENFRIKLRSYRKEDIIITDHAEVRAILREIDLEEIRNNIINPDKLVYVEEQKADKLNEEKYGCYFAYSEKYCHKYVLVINRKVIIVTIIIINRDWQKAIKK
ncbi:MAG: hypothetical protein KKF56_02885 [Nanoarchaeota archaeon]|nr:hypothetical protein [Nanoarchaeota archaeon]